LKIVQRWGGGIHMNKGRVGEDRGSKETDRCPLTIIIAFCRMVDVTLAKVESDCEVGSVNGKYDWCGRCIIDGA
jgi:hypothetical protein